jgi:hypothetical protein
VPWASISVSLAVLAGAAALGGYGLSHFRDREPAPLAEAQLEAAPTMDFALAEVAEPAPVAAPVPVVQSAPTVVQPQAAPAPERAIQKRAAKRRGAPVLAMAPAVDDAAVAAAARERQQRDYEEAVARYDASEREEGFQWAKTNRVRVARHCKTTARRTDAFMEGCLSFVTRASERGGSRAASPSTAEVRDRSET